MQGLTLLSEDQLPLLMIIIIKEWYAAAVKKGRALDNFSAIHESYSSFWLFQ